MIAPVLALLLNVPPPPPPPADQVEAATAVIHLAPVSDRASAAERAIAIYGIVQGIYAGSPRAGELEATLRQRLTARVENNAPFGEAFDQCLTYHFAYIYDAPTLRSIGQIVTTPGGQALWQNSLAEPVRDCYRRTLADFVQGNGLAGALNWLKREQPTGTLPFYVTGKDSLGDLSTRLIAFCGPATGAGLVERHGRLMIAEGWSSKGRNRRASACLIHGARLAGYDLNTLLEDGTTAITIS